jgi:hypothetical protein
MNNKDLGVALCSEIIFINNKSVGISPTVFTYIEEETNFVNGGLTSVDVGDVMRGTLSQATAIVISTKVESGSWKENNACGFIRMKSRSGNFIAGEKVSVGPESDRIIIGEVKEFEGEYPRKYEHASSVFISVPPTTDSLVDHAAVIISVDGSNLDRNYSMGHVIPEAKKWVLFGIQEIMKARFIGFVAGKTTQVIATAYFERK